MSEALRILSVGAGTLLAIVVFAVIVCPTGITTHNARLQRGLVVEEKWQRDANYATGMNKDIEMIAHACGVAHPGLLRREHCRIVQANGASAALNILYPYPTPKAGPVRPTAGVAPVQAGAQSKEPAHAAD